jgi:hypothetical protein
MRPAGPIPMISRSKSGSKGGVDERRAGNRIPVLIAALAFAVAPSLFADEGAAGAPAFWGTRLINLPTTTIPGKGELLVRISHRFTPKADSGYDSFYGLDGPASVLLGFGYGITDDLEIRLDRSNLYQEWELGAGWRILKPSAGSSLPIAAVLGAGVGWASQKIAGRDRTDGRNFKVNLQLSMSARITSRWTLLAVPAFSSHTDHWDASPTRTVALGLGTRYLVFRDFSLIAEWIPVIDGYKNAQNAWGLGIEKRAGRHVFQVFVSNSLGMTSAQFIPGGDLRIQDADFRFGFNIFRSF